MQKCFKLTSFRHKYQDLDFRSLHKYENMIAVVFLIAQSLDKNCEDK